MESPNFFLPSYLNKKSPFSLATLPFGLHILLSVLYQSQKIFDQKLLLTFNDRWEFIDGWWGLQTEKKNRNEMLKKVIIF